MKRNTARWRTIEARLGRESTLWIATVRPDGRPHLTPVWFIWLEGKIYIAIGKDTQKFANLLVNQSVAVSLPDTENVLIIEGQAHAAGEEKFDTVALLFLNKFEWDFRYDETADWQLIEVTPLKVLVWGDGYEEAGYGVMTVM